MQFHCSGWSHFKMRGARHIFEQQHILAFGATVHMYTSLPSHCRVRAIAKHIPRLLIFFVIFLRWFWIFFIIVRICSGFTRLFFLSSSSSSSSGISGSAGIGFGIGCLGSFKSGKISGRRLGTALTYSCHLHEN
jgi:hypothetical protein